MSQLVIKILINYLYKIKIKNLNKRKLRILQIYSKLMKKFQKIKICI